MLVLFQVVLSVKRSKYKKSGKGWDTAGIQGFLDGARVKNLPARAGDTRDTGSIPGLGRSWRRRWQLTPVFLPGESHGQRSLAGYSPWGRTEWYTTEWLSTAQPGNAGGKVKAVGQWKPNTSFAYFQPLSRPMASGFTLWGCLDIFILTEDFSRCWCVNAPFRSGPSRPPHSLRVWRLPPKTGFKVKFDFLYSLSSLNNSVM